ncbi:MAG: IS982 family transposase [Anaerolineae bacterium]|nr:IS982 family transposase [Anaerolineae bacterium]MCW5854168.1 IS982 family transposase [Anaerolineae bacterium]
METPLPSQAYIDSLVATIQSEGLTQERLCHLLFAVIDQFCTHLAARSGPGRPKTYSDSTILKLDMLMHLTGKRGETEILREVQRHYRAYFDKLPDQSRLWHRIRTALPLIERFRRHLRASLGVDYEDIRILDTLPIPVADRHARAGRGNGFQRADGGYCASKQLKYYGFKLGMLITPQGIPDVYELFSARPHDVHTLMDLLDESHDILALGDKGFVSDPKRAALAENQHVWLLTYRRSNQHVQNTPLEAWALKTFRPLIETVFSQLAGHMHIEQPGAKTDIGLAKRLVGIVTAYTLGIYLNALLARRLLAIKELFA